MASCIKHVFLLSFYARDKLHGVSTNVYDQNQKSPFVKIGVKISLWSCISSCLKCCRHHSSLLTDCSVTLRNIAVLHFTCER